MLYTHLYDLIVEEGIESQLNNFCYQMKRSSISRIILHLFKLLAKSNPLGTPKQPRQFPRGCSPRVDDYAPLPETTLIQHGEGKSIWCLQSDFIPVCQCPCLRRCKQLRRKHQRSHKTFDSQWHPSSKYASSGVTQSRWE